MSLTDSLIELMVAAIQTNVCNVFNFQLAATVDETVFELATTPYTKGSYHSEISHSTARQSDQTQIDRFLFGKVAQTFKMLSTPISSSAGQSYADNCLIYVSGDIGAGDVPSNHSSHNLIAMTLSGKNIPIKPGRCLAVASQPKGQGFPSNQLLISLMESIGASDWKTVLSGQGSDSTKGFGIYGGHQRSLTAAEKQAGLPFMNS